MWRRIVFVVAAFCLWLASNLSRGATYESEKLGFRVGVPEGTTIEERDNAIRRVADQAGLGFLPLAQE